MVNSASDHLSTSSFQVLDQFLVCGLGSLGQHCVVALKEFGVRAIAIEQVPPPNWEIPHLSELLDDLIVGDCRQNRILKQANISQCRAALLVTSNERVNIETAIAIRQLNSQTRLVIRSGQSNLNKLLFQQLGNFIAFEPTQLSTPALALAALGSEILGLFDLDGQQLRVVKRQIKSNDPWCRVRLLHELNNPARRILFHLRQPNHSSQSFHQWEPNEIVLSEDTLVYLETAEQFFLPSTPQPATFWGQSRHLRWHKIFFHGLDQWQERISRFGLLSFRQQVRRVALICSAIVVVLLLMGTALFRWYYPGTSWLSAFYVTAILLLGGFSDLFDSFEPITDIPWWLQLFGLVLNLAGTAFVGVLYALLTEALLSSKFEFIKQRPPIPQKDHIVIIGLGRVGREVAGWLQQLKQPLVGISLNADCDLRSRRVSERSILPQMPLIVGNLTEAFPQANLSTAKSVVVLTDDEILNLEVALMTRAKNLNSHLVIRTTGQQLSEHLTGLLPNTQVLCTYTVAAEAFAGAAFGEKIINLFRFNERTILVTEYQIEVEDTLNGLLLAEVAYGYGVVPILHQKPNYTSVLLPLEDYRLAIGDRLVILATIEGLQRIEQGKLNSHLRCWQVLVEKALTQDAVFEGANVIARISGCSLATARNLMKGLPQLFSVPLYKHQAQRLVRQLNKIMVKAHLVSISAESKN
jgi:Trk K+ transport system NAD-binding subunit